MSVFDIAVLMAGAGVVFVVGWVVWTTSSDDRAELAVRQVRWLRARLGRRS